MPVPAPQVRPQPLTEPALPLSHFRFWFRFDPPSTLPAYAGSAWRGALGHALKRSVCVVRTGACGDCMLYRQCAYPYIFETPPPPDTTKLRRYDAAPHPFVLRPGEARGCEYPLELILVGRGAGHLPYLIHALERAGHDGIGARRQPLELLSVDQAAPTPPPMWGTVFRPGEPIRVQPPVVPAVPPPPGTVRVCLHTPLRVRRAEHYVGSTEFGFDDFFSPLLRRISLLSHFHTDTPLQTDFAGLTALAQTVPLTRPELRWHDWTRYSSRQKTPVQMGGLVGSFQVDRLPSPLWPYLWLGQWLHNGKGTSMGLGRYTLECTDHHPEPAAATP